MATLYKSDGTQVSLEPVKEQFSDYELTQYVEGEYKVYYFTDSTEVIVVNPDALVDGQPLNVRATEYMRKKGSQSVIYGNAIVCQSSLIA